jgi:hypothetical protein
LEKISKVLEARYAITIKFASVVHGATDDEAKGFIRSQSPSMFLLKHVSELVGDTAVNMACADLNEDELIPHFFALDASTFAHSAPARSSSSSNKKDTSTHDRRPSAGFSFGMMEEMAAKHSPKHICVEVVPGLGQPTSMELTCNLFKDRGYASWMEGNNDSDFGSPVPRDRFFGGAIGDLHEGVNHDEVVHHFLSIVRAFKLVRPVLAETIITFGDRERAEEARLVGLPTLTGTGLKNVKEKSDADWKYEHKTMFMVQNITWPVDLEKEGNCVGDIIDFSGMSRREAEATVFLDRVFAPPANPEGEQCVEFIDINMGLARLTASCLEEEIRTPWALGCPTPLTSTSKMLMRCVVSGHRSVRLLDAIEYMRLVGWVDSDWMPLDWKAMYVDEAAFTEAIAGFAGTTLAGFQYAAVQMATLSTWGMFGNHSELRCKHNPPVPVIVMAPAPLSESYSDEDDDEV